MRNYLIESGFSEGDFPEEFILRDWTIRLYDDVLEVYSGIEDGETGVYWIGENNWENLITIVDEILGIETLEIE